MNTHERPTPTRTCPRCMRRTLYENGAHNALSRLDNRTHICPSCGLEEALAGMKRHTDPDAIRPDA